jgi:hypothetical protein
LKGSPMSNVWLVDATLDIGLFVLLFNDAPAGSLNKLHQ